MNKTIFGLAIIVIITGSINAAQGSYTTPSWVKNLELWYADGDISETEYVNAIVYLSENGVIILESDCSGEARCITGVVTQVIDGDTIKIDDQSFRFSLTSTPEMDTAEGVFAKEFVEYFCPVGSLAIADEDDKQTQGSYGRIIAVIHCNGINLNEAVLEAGHGSISAGFCDTSEFSDTSWAQKFGCGVT